MNKPIYLHSNMFLHILRIFLVTSIFFYFNKQLIIPDFRKHYLRITYLLEFIINLLNLNAIAIQIQKNIVNASCIHNRSSDIIE